MGEEIVADFVEDNNSAMLLLCFLFSCFVLCRQINKGTKRGLVFSDKFISFPFFSLKVEESKVSQ